MAESSCSFVTQTLLIQAESERKELREEKNGHAWLDRINQI